MNKREWMLQASLAGLNGGFRLGPIDLTVQHLGEVYDAICAATPETPQEGAWVEHDGDVSKAPEEGRVVEVRDKKGFRHSGPSEVFAWDWCDDDMDVVRWRYA